MEFGIYYFITTFICQAWYPHYDDTDFVKSSDEGKDRVKVIPLGEDSSFWSE